MLKPSGTLVAFAAKNGETPKTLKIDDDVPGPTLKYGTKKILFRDTLLAMKVNQSFFVAHEKDRTTIYGLAKDMGMKVTIRPEKDGYRVWRV